MVVRKRCSGRRNLRHGLARPSSLWHSHSNHLVKLRQCSLEGEAFQGNQIEYRYQLARLEIVDLSGQTGMPIDLTVVAYVLGETSRLESHLVVELIYVHVTSWFECIDMILTLSRRPKLWNPENCIMQNFS